MSASIGGVVFLKNLLKDGEIEPDSVNERLQEYDGELSDKVRQFTTNKIYNPEYHYIYDNLADRPSDEDPSEEIV